MRARQSNFLMRVGIHTRLLPVSGELIQSLGVHQIASALVDVLLVSLALLTGTSGLRAPISGDVRQRHICVTLIENEKVI